VFLLIGNKRKKQDYWDFSHSKSAKFSALTLSFLIVSNVATGIVVYILNDDTQTKAATFYWLQSDWSGGISSTSRAVHTDGPVEDWNQFYSGGSLKYTTTGELRMKREVIINGTVMTE